MRKLPNWKVLGVLGFLLALALAVGYGQVTVIPRLPPGVNSTRRPGFRFFGGAAHSRDAQESDT